MVRKYHPDVSDHHDVENQFKEVNEAYEVLKDATKRAEYDEIRQYGEQQKEFRPPPGWQPSGSARGDEGGGIRWQGNPADLVGKNPVNHSCQQPKWATLASERQGATQ